MERVEANVPVLSNEEMWEILLEGKEPSRN